MAIDLSKVRAVPARSGAPVIALARNLDEAGTFALSFKNGQPLATRTQYVDAEQLVMMIRDAVREDRRAFLAELRAHPELLNAPVSG